MAQFSILVIWILFAIGIILPFSFKPADAADDILALIGPKDALLVTAPDGSVILAANETAKRVPASTLKLLTSLVALHYLGPDYRFPTDFFIDRNKNLKIKGYGDPLLISEIIDDIGRKLSRNLSTINDIVLDDTYFSHSILIPGRSITRNPYDAPNGALCANFNTVKFKQVYGRYISAEPQTPLLPFVLPKIRASGVKSGRIVLSHHHNENVLYAGHLFHHFLKRHGIQCRGSVRAGEVNAETDRRVRRYISPFALTDVIMRLLEHSNNYMANQLLIATGAKMHAPPGNLKNGVRAVLTYMNDALEIQDIRLVEGSGISRQNRLSARTMIRILAAFEPYRHLLPHEGREYYKTGSLHGIRTRAGYIESVNGGFYRFAVLMNTVGKSAEKVARLLVKQLP